MSNNLKEELIKFRLVRAEESFSIAIHAASQKYWNSVASDLYYTCFYLISALFAKNDIKTSTHSGVKTVFGSEFIKKEKVDAKWGKLLNDLFEKRQLGDYGDFVFLSEEEIYPLIQEVEEFKNIIKKMIQV